MYNLIGQAKNRLGDILAASCSDFRSTSSVTIGLDVPLQVMTIGEKLAVQIFAIRVLKFSTR
jgi:hypothetical protein